MNTGWADCRIGGWKVVTSLLLSAAPTLRLSAQCPDGSPPPCRHAAASPQSIAVLYFDLLSPDSSDVYVAEGVTEELIAQLGSRPRLAVKSRTAVLAYRRTAVAPAALGRALGVAYLVSGSVRRAGKHWRIAVELVDAATGIRVWGDQYDRENDDPLIFQADVAHAVAKAVEDRLTRNLKAIERAQRGDSALARRTPTGLTLAVAEYQAAARLDPGYAAALARAALARLLLLELRTTWVPETPESLLSRGTAGGDSALRLDPASADGWAARGLGLSSSQPQVPPESREALERAATLDPENVEVLELRGLLLERLGEDSAAQGAWRQALVVNPGNAAALYALGIADLDRRRFISARRWLDSATAMNPTSPVYAARARVRLALDDVPGARRDAEAARHVSEGDVMPGEATLALVEIREGDSTQARRRAVKLLRLALADSTITPPEAFWLATMLATLGASSGALDVLEVARPAGAALWLELRAPELDPLREDPRFTRLVEATRPRPAT